MNTRAPGIKSNDNRTTSFTSQWGLFCLIQAHIPEVCVGDSHAAGRGGTRGNMHL